MKFYPDEIPKDFLQEYGEEKLFWKYSGVSEVDVYTRFQVELRGLTPGCTVERVFGYDSYVSENGVAQRVHLSQKASPGQVFFDTFKIISFRRDDRIQRIFPFGSSSLPPEIHFQSIGQAIEYQ